MLEKPADIDIPKDQPFVNDQLHRQPCAQNLTTLIRTLKQPFVLSVNGSWGTGKTTFIKMWRQSLENDGHLCLFFNAWENDFATDPIVSFISEMDRVFQRRPEAADRWKKAKALGAGLIRNVATEAVKKATHGLVDPEKLVETMRKGEKDDALVQQATEIATQRLAAYRAEAQAIAAFRENLGELGQQLRQADGAKAPVLFFVDELDRCRPDYAICLLERINHLFNVPNIVFVLALDRE